MFNNMSTVDLNFGYDVHMQSCSNTMNYSSLQASDFDLRRFTPLDINQGPSEHPCAHW